jgi:hypothetical protein
MNRTLAEASSIPIFSAQTCWPPVALMTCGVGPQESRCPEERETISRELARGRGRVHPALAHQGISAAKTDRASLRWPFRYGPTPRP